MAMCVPVPSAHAVPSLPPLPSLAAQGHGLVPVGTDPELSARQVGRQPAWHALVLHPLSWPGAGASCVVPLVCNVVKMLVLFPQFYSSVEVCCCSRCLLTATGQINTVHQVHLLKPCVGPDFSLVAHTISLSPDAPQTFLQVAVFNFPLI